LFNKGDMAVYPAHGVGEITNIETKKIGDLEQAFYVMHILDSNMTVMVPTISSDSVGLREIIASDEVSRVFDILKEKGTEIEARPWNQRYRKYMEKIKTGSLYEIAGVLRDLYLLKEDKELSFGERKMMDTAKSLLMTEIAIANHIKKEQVEEDIDKVFA